MAKKTADGGGSATSPAAVFRDVTARDITLQFGLTSAPATYRSLIRRFLRAYLGSPEAPVPFGGRDAQIAELNQWLADPDASSNLCVTAPAGRGKTALLVRWLGQVDREAWPVAFVPISMRYETNRAATFYQALAARLAEILGEALPTTPADPASFYRDKVIEYLDLFYEKDRRCLVVIDGLDEAAGWQADTSVLPLDPAPGLRIVASARLLAGDRGSADWLRRLGWSARQEMAQTLEVRLLDRDDIADVLETMGYPLAPLSGQVDVLAELLRLTAGEPLLIELYMRALLERGDQAARLRAEELRDLKPGFAGYFKAWWEQQRRAWHDEGSAVDEQTVQAILAVLACALGPLTLSDLAHLIREIHGVDRIVSADSLHPIRRFVIGDGVEVGYSFSHPKLADYFRDEHFGTGEVIHQTRAGFVEWGRKTVRALNEGVLAPSENPGYRYLLDHYSQHLRQEDEPPEQFVELVEDGWRRAWETYEGGFQGFASAVQVAWDTLKETRQTNRWVSLSPSRCLGAEIRCALSLSSLCSLGSNMSMTLLDTALAAGRISSPQALHLAELETNPLKRVQKLLAIRLYLREPQRHETLAAALSMARAIEFPSARAQALIEVIPHLSATRRGEVVDAALDAARAVQDPASRAQRLIAVAPHLPEAQRQEVLADALAVAGTVEAPTQRVPIIAALAPQLPEFLLQRAFTAVEAIDGDWLRARALSVLVPRLPEALLGNALDAAWAMDDPSARAEALIALAPRLPEPRRLEVLAGALAAAGAVEKPLARAAALAALAPQVPEALLPDALAAAKALERSARATALPPFAQRLPEVQRKEIFSEALDSAQAVKNPRYRVKVLIAVSAHLTGEERDRALTAGLDAVKAINDQSHRAQSLISLAPHLPESGLPDALAVATTVGDLHHRVGVLDVLAPRLSGVLLGGALTAAQAVADPDARALTLADLGPAPAGGGMRQDAHRGAFSRESGREPV